MGEQAVGLEQVGGVSHAAKGMVENADGRVQAAKSLRAVAEGTHGRMVGPAGNMMRSTMDGHVAASSMAGLHGARTGESFSKGEKHVVQGTEDSLQQQKTSASEAETTFSALNRPMEA